MEEKIKQSMVERYHLDQIDQILLKHLAQFPTTGLSELSRIINYSVTGTQKRITKPAFKRAMADLQESTDDALTRVANQAVRKLGFLIESTELKVALKACEVTLAHYFNSKQGQTSKAETTITFSSQIGSDGAIVREMSEVTTAEGLLI